MLVKMLVPCMRTILILEVWGIRRWNLHRVVKTKRRSKWPKKIHNHQIPPLTKCRSWSRLKRLPMMVLLTLAQGPNSKMNLSMIQLTNQVRRTKKVKLRTMRKRRTRPLNLKLKQWCRWCSATSQTISKYATYSSRNALMQITHCQQPHSNRRSTTQQITTSLGSKRLDHPKAGATLNLTSK